jgi:hypothetical protein
MKILSILFKVNILILLFSSSVFSQKGNDTITVMDVKSFIEPYQNKNPDTIAYMLSEYPAVFPGGRDSLNAYVKMYLFSKSIQVAKNKTMILCTFIIEKSGCVSEVEILAPNNQNSVLENGVKNALYSSPTWNPASQDGKKLRFKIMLPFYFP